MAYASGPAPESAALLPSAGPKVYELRGWSKRKNPERVAIISKIGRDAGSDPRLARLAVAIFRAKGIQPRDYRGQAAALHEFLRDHVYFVNEPDERLQDPAYTLDLQPDGSVGPNAAGDCDDFCVAMIALCRSVGLPARAVTSGKLGKRHVRWIEGVGRSPNARWSHIYTAVSPHPFKPKYDAKTWSFADPTVPGAPYGWDVIQARQSDPQMGGHYAGASSLGASEEDVVAGFKPQSAFQIVAIGVVTALTIDLFKRQSWWPKARG